MALFESDSESSESSSRSGDDAEISCGGWPTTGEGRRVFARLLSAVDASVKKKSQHILIAELTSPIKTRAVAAWTEEDTNQTHGMHPLTAAMQDFANRCFELDGKCRDLYNRFCIVVSNFLAAWADYHRKNITRGYITQRTIDVFGDHQMIYTPHRAFDIMGALRGISPALWDDEPAHEVVWTAASKVSMSATDLSTPQQKEYCFSQALDCSPHAIVEALQWGVQFIHHPSPSVELERQNTFIRALLAYHMESETHGVDVWVDALGPVGYTILNTHVGRTALAVWPTNKTLLEVDKRLTRSARELCGSRFGGYDPLYKHTGKMPETRACGQQQDTLFDGRVYRSMHREARASRHDESASPLTEEVKTWRASVGMVSAEHMQHVMFFTQAIGLRKKRRTAINKPLHLDPSLPTSAFPLKRATVDATRVSVQVVIPKAEDGAQPQYAGRSNFYAIPISLFGNTLPAVLLSRRYHTDECAGEFPWATIVMPSIAIMHKYIEPLDAGTSIAVRTTKFAENFESVVLSMGFGIKGGRSPAMSDECVLFDPSALVVKMTYSGGYVSSAQHDSTDRLFAVYVRMLKRISASANASTPEILAHLMRRLVDCVQTAYALHQIGSYRRETWHDAFACKADANPASVLVLGFGDDIYTRRVLEFIEDASSTWKSVLFKRKEDAPREDSRRKRQRQAHEGK